MNTLNELRGPFAVKEEIDFSEHDVGDIHCSACHPYKAARCACVGVIHEQWFDENMYGPSTYNLCDQCGERHKDLMTYPVPDAPPHWQNVGDGPIIWLGATNKEHEFDFYRACNNAPIAV